MGGIPPILSSTNASYTPPDASAVAPPNLGGDAQPAPTYYEQLRSIYNDAVRASHMKNPNGSRMFSTKDIDQWVRQTASETFRGAHNFRTFGHLVNTLQNLDSKGARPITEDDLSPAEKGAVARTVLFGHSVLPFTDEIAGLMSWAGNKLGLNNAGGAPGAKLEGQGYRAGRDENRRYLANARRFAANSNSRLNPINPETWGLPATILATLGSGAAPTQIGPRIPMLSRVAGAASPAEAPGFFRSTVTGAGYGLGYGLADQPELTPDALRENAVPLAIDALGGALLGGGSALVGRKLAAIRQPGPLHMEEVLNASGATHPLGGPGALADAVAASGTPRPMLAELDNSSFSGLAQEMRMQSREATATARKLLQQQLDAIRAQKAEFNPAYEALRVPVDDPRLASLMQNDRVRSVVNALLRDKQIAAGEPLTGRALEDIRRELGKRANRAFRKGDTRVGALMADFEAQARTIIDEGFQQMPDVRQQLSPILQRERRLEIIQRRLERMPRRANVPMETKTTAHSEAMREMGREKFQLAHRGFQQMAGPLFTPGTAAEHLHRLHELLPWYYYMGRAAPAASALPQLNPFFAQEPQDSVPQEP
jgi:hypothetical protein